MNEPLRHYAEAFANLNGAASKITLRLGTFALLQEYPRLGHAITEVHDICNMHIPVNDLAQLNRTKHAKLVHPSFVPKPGISEITSIYESVNSRVMDVKEADNIADYISAELEADQVIRYLRHDQKVHIEYAGNLLVTSRAIGRIAHELVRSYDLYC